MIAIDSTLVGEPFSAAPAVTSHPSVLVLGVGNVLMGDEGVGIHVIRQLETAAPVAGVRLLDGGTGGVSLLTEFDSIAAIILVDATRDGRPDGCITYLEPRNVVELPRGLGAHDFGLKDLFAASALIGRLPELHLYTVSVSALRPMCLELSPSVAGAVSPLASLVREHAARLAHALSLRTRRQD